MNTQTATHISNPAQSHLHLALSAWMDGAPLPAGVSEAALLDWLLAAQGAPASWQSWHLVGDALRSSQPMFAPAAATQPVGSAPWQEQLQQRLTVTRVASLTEDVLAMDDAESIAAAPAGLPVHRPTPLPLPARPAANAPLWRWKMAAGFASVTAAGLLGWNLMMLQPGMQPAAQATATLLAATDHLPAAPLDAHSADRVTVADVHLDRLLLAHAQLDGQALLPDVALAGEDEQF